MSKNTYIIGDIHGEYDTLIALVNKLPKDSKLIFVGDLVDRGPKSNQVIKFVRENNHLCCMGNHEHMMIHYGKNFINTYPSNNYKNFTNVWINNGGKYTLFSYGLLEVDKYDGKLLCIENEEAFKQLQDDIKWLETLPLYIEIPKIKKDGKKIVISHASMADVWHHHNNPKAKETFQEYALWHRTPPNKDCEIFNIYGHSIIDQIDTSLHYLNIDTGCFVKDEIIRELSAYCIEEDKIISQRRV